MVLDEHPAIQPRRLSVARGWLIRGQAELASAFEHCERNVEFGISLAVVVANTFGVDDQNSGPFGDAINEASVALSVDQKSDLVTTGNPQFLASNVLRS